jgi:F-type H+-transporting ATPase subunit a
MITTSLVLLLLSPLVFILLMVFGVLEFGVCFIQAYVFTLLLCSYIKDSIDLH